MSDNYEKTGYLTSHFKMFHLKDQKKLNVNFHYHDFHKVLIVLQGHLQYSIEGRDYDLMENDIIFVNAGEVHKPIVDENSCYERIIIYVSKDFLASYEKDDSDLSWCFKQASANRSHVLRIPSFKETRLSSILLELENNLSSTEFASELYSNLLFLEFMVQLNRAALSDTIQYISTSSSNQKIIEIIDYVNQNLTKDISIETLSETFYISRSHLMHTFKNTTGYTLASYIKTKRLLLARDMIANGGKIMDTCYACGFNNYSTFSRAYKSAFGTAPRKNN